MAVSALHFLDTKGRIILSRDYRGDIPSSQAERFFSKLNDLEDGGHLTPVVYDDGNPSSVLNVELVH